jgi:hypothetical protein
MRKLQLRDTEGFEEEKEGKIVMKKLSFTVFEEELHHQEMCDASAAIAVGNSNYFIVANDDDNILRVYQAKTSDKPSKEIDINNYFKNNPRQKEVDIEGVALLDGVVYWITSHGRNKDGELKLQRRQFFATKITGQGKNTSVEQEGVSYEKLLQDVYNLLKDTELKKYFESINLEQDLRPEEQDGINIEGLCATPDLELLIGFRNPIPNGKALLIPLKNAAKLVRQEDSSAKLGEPIMLDLGGRGIRSIEYWNQYNLYLICAGAFDDSSNFCLYQWSGNLTENPEKIDFTFPKDFRPESILFYPNQDDLLHILSDDGSLKRDGINECKKLPREQRYFRSIWVKVN